MIVLKDGRSELYQWDTGRILTVDSGIDQLHFARNPFGRSIDADAADGETRIPDIILQAPGEIHVWGFVGTPDDGYTKVSKVFRVQPRNKPADYVFTPPEQTTLAQVMARLDLVPEEIDEALAQAKESGEFDGEPGAPGTSPHIGDNGNWFVGETDTGVKAQGEDYALTEDDKTEIAQQAAALVDVPEVVQTRGDSETAVISQAAATREFAPKTKVLAAGNIAVIGENGEYLDSGYPLKHTVESWEDVQAIVRAGLASKVFTVGDQLECRRDGVTLTWDIIGFDCDTPTNPELTHSMTLQMHGGWKPLQFDEKEALYYCETELAAGTYHFALLAGYDTTYGGGKTYSFTLTKPVPSGGVIMFPWGYLKQAAETKISTYASRESTTVLESVSVTEGANGTSLGTADGNGTNMNHSHRIRYGSNKYSTSAMRQLLNSDAAAGSVWTPQTIFDRPPIWAATQNGFLAGLDPDFLAVVADVKKRTALNTITDGGGYEDTVEKFFLLSRSEVYAGLENSVNEGNPYPYYSDFSDLSAAGTGADGNRIKYMDGVAVYWWLRSPYASNARYVRIVNPSGTLSEYDVFNVRACAPACTIA